MKVAIIGGTGHIGSYLTPRLVRAGHEVLCVSRGTRAPYHPDAAWEAVQQVVSDRSAEEEAGTFGERIAALGAEAVIDITCYTPESARQLAEALRGRVGHLLHCGTIWIHGHSIVVPTTETAARAPFGEYGIRKAQIEAYLLGQVREGLPVTLLHPGHLVGVGWNPVNPQGNFNPEVFSRLASGEEVALPNIGMETVHHVHADDVALAFMCALEHRDTALGESFHVVSEAAITLRGYAEQMAAWFGREPSLRFLPWEEWKSGVSEKDARSTWDHIAHSPNCSIAKAKQRIGYAPRYTSLAAVQECVSDLIARGVVRA